MMWNRFTTSVLFLCGQKILTLALVLAIVFVDFSKLPLLGRILAPVGPQTAQAASGDFSIFRENAGGEVVSAGTSPVSVTWDTEVVEATGIELQGDNTSIDLSEGGKYLVLYNVWTNEGAGGAERRSFESYLTLNGTEIPYGRGDGYIRDSGGDNDAYNSGVGIIDATAGDDLQVVIARDDTNTETAGIRGGTNGVSVLKINDSFDYLRIKKNTNVTDISGNTTFTDVVWDVSDELDTGSFSFTPGNADVSLLGGVDEHFLVSANVGILQTANSGNRQNYEMVLTLDGVEIPGTKVTTYPRGNANADGIYQGTLAYAGIIKKNAIGSQTLNVEVRREGQGSATTQLTGADTALAIVALPDTADYVMLTSTSTSQTLSNSATAFAWNEQIEVDTAAFSHSEVTNNSRINFDVDGDYLFFSTAYTSRTSNTARNSPVIEWRLDGSTTLSYGGHGSFNRGDQGSADAYTSGSSGGVILSAVTDTQYLEVTKRDEAAASPNAVFPAGEIAVQGVELSKLFGTDVTVSASGTQAISADIPTTDFYTGDQFVVTESTASRNVTNITITESGSVDAANSLDNIKLFYEFSTVAPYDCSEDSYDGVELQYGSTDTNGFSGANGISSFTDSVSISPTQSLCVYPVMDITASSSNADTLAIAISDPSSDITVTAGGTVGPATEVALTGSTTLRNAELTQVHYNWRNDDGSETTATSVEGVEDVPATGFANGTIRRLRVGVSAEGSTSSAATQYRLEYGQKVTTCDAVSAWVDVGTGGAGDWDVVNSPNLTDGNDTTNVALQANGGITDENTTFLTPNGGQKDTSSQTGNITLTSTEFVELEFAIEPTVTAPQGNSYCFRVSDAGTALRNYDVYPEATISADIAVSSLGSQVATLSSGSSGAHVGGAFVVARDGTARTITEVTVTESGSINAQTNLDTVELYYDLDTSAPYDCASESYAGTEAQFGATDTDGFSAPNGTSTFTGSLAVSTTQTACLYVVLDVLSSSTNGEIINVEIANPAVDVLVTGSTVGPSSPVDITSSTSVAAAVLTQTGYHWRLDTGTEATAGSATGGTQNTELTQVPRDTTYRLRYQVSNEGTVGSNATQYRLEYGTKVTTCANVGTWQDVDVGVAFTMESGSQLVEGANTTDIAQITGGVTNPGGKTFLTPNAGQKENNSQTGNITLSNTQFVELEYALSATDQSGFDTTYCFRLSNNGTALTTYDEYAELTTREKQDFNIQRGTLMVDGTGVTLTAGVDYVAPAATSSAFVRITTSQLTGAGNQSGGGNQNADDITAYISDQSDITTDFTIGRPTTATASTSVDWEIIEYTGLTGADNEMIVRAVDTITYGSGARIATGTTVSTIADDDDVVVFLTGQSTNETAATNFMSALSTTLWSSTSSVPVMQRETAGDAGNVSYAVVEFTGQNWQIQRIEHNYTAAGTAQIEPMSPVNSLSRAFVHAQKRSGNTQNGLDDYGHRVWLSSIGQVSFQLNGGSTAATDHTSVAWVVENLQTGSGAMTVYRDADSVDSNEAVEPRSTAFSFGGTLNSVSNGSLFITNDSTGGGTAYPRPMLGATIINTTQFEVFESDAGQTQVFRAEVVEWPVAELTFRQDYYRFYVDNDAITPVDPWPAGASNLGENTSITSTDDPLGETERVRIRMTIAVSNALFPESTVSFKLQYGRRDGASCSAVSSWNDVGAPGGGEIWRGFAATPVDGNELPSTVLSGAVVAGTYEEQNNSAVNPNSANSGESVEYDWLVEHNGAAQRTDYCFRMVESDGTLLTGYNNYPTLRTTGYTPVIGDWRWYTDEGSVTPSTPLAAENVAPTDIALNEELKLRVTAVEVENAASADVNFDLQYSEYADFSQAVYTLTATTSCTATSTWCYADGAGVDNAVIPSAVISTADSCVAGVGDGCGTHNESNLSSGSLSQAAGSSMELEFTLKQAAGRVNGVYYFRLVDTTSDDPLVASTSYPSLVIEGPTLVFSISGVDANTTIAGVTTDATTTPTTIDFGSLPFNTDVVLAQRINVETNATNGYQVFKYADQQLLNSYGTAIAAITSDNATPSSWATACAPTASGCFGYHTTDSTLEGASGRFAPIDSYAALNTSLDEIMYSSISATDEHEVVYRTQISELQPAGDYQTNITYIAVPSY